MSVSQWVRAARTPAVYLSVVCARASHYDQFTMRWIADVVYLIAGIVYLPVLLYQALVLGKNRSGWGDRFGRVPRCDPGTRRIWVHAVSLGEVNATPRLISLLRERLPDYDIVVSTTTDTGFTRAVALYGRDKVFRFPLDFSFVIRRALDCIQPSMIVLMELEVWYNLVLIAGKRNIPITIANGRLTEHSARRLKRLGRAARPMFAGLSWVGAQDEAIAERFRSLGVATDRVEIIPSLKWDSATVGDSVPGADALAAALGIEGSAPVWVCGSTGPAEEEMLLSAFEALCGHSRIDDSRFDAEGRARLLPSHYSGGAATGNDDPNSTDQWAARNVQSDSARNRIAPVLVIVPRKPERFDDVASMIERRGFECLRRSAAPDGTTPVRLSSDRGRVILGDTMGELRKFYSLADVVFVGRTLVPMGGSDPMEVAALGKAMIVGPHTENFRAPVEQLQCADALRVVDSVDSLQSQLRTLLENATRRQSMGARARDVVVRNQGGTVRTADRLVEIASATARGDKPSPDPGLSSNASRTAEVAST